MSKETEFRTPVTKTRVNTAVIFFLGIGGYFLFTEHLAHTVQALPYILLLSCIAICIYMVRSHGGDEDENLDDSLESDGGRRER